jgi:hypothetical protein
MLWFLNLNIAYICIACYWKIESYLNNYGGLSNWFSKSKEHKAALKTTVLICFKLKYCIPLYNSCVKIVIF